MRVLKGLLVSLKTRMPPDQKNSLLILSAASGGERQRSSISSDTGYSETAQRTGKPAYLELISQSMQKPIEGSIPLLKNVEDRSAIGGSRNQKHAEKTRALHRRFSLNKRGLQFFPQSTQHLTAKLRQKRQKLSED